MAPRVRREAFLRPIDFRPDRQLRAIGTIIDADLSENEPAALRAALAQGYETAALLATPENSGGCSAPVN